jgi:hypothetical protein
MRFEFHLPPAFANSLDISLKTLYTYLHEKTAGGKKS